MSWNDAIAYCSWLGKKVNATFRLPTEAEWGRVMCDTVHRKSGTLPRALEMQNIISLINRDFHDKGFFYHQRASNITRGFNVTE